MTQQGRGLVRGVVQRLLRALLPQQRLLDLGLQRWEIGCSS